MDQQESLLFLLLGTSKSAHALHRKKQILKRMMLDVPPRL
jgi:hypothetical protein